MTTIAKLQDGKWYVVQSRVIAGTCVWYPITAGYDTSEQARAAQTDIVFGRV